MDLVTDVNQVLRNIIILERVRLGQDLRHGNAYRSLIKKGTCFLPYATSTGLGFATSRFIGYAVNDFEKHAANDRRDGRQTTAALNIILGHHPVREATVEQEYRRFCGSVGIEPSRTGTYGVERKFWVTPDVRDRLDLLAEEKVLADPRLTQTEKEQIVKARVGQGRFRDALLAKWKRCCITGTEVEPILRASHIKPWHASTNIERLDPFNGLLLSANMDALFDRGLISFSDDGEVLCGSQVSLADLNALGCRTGLKIKLSGRHAPYLQFHRNEVFGPRQVTRRVLRSRRST